MLLRPSQAQALSLTAHPSALDFAGWRAHQPPLPTRLAPDRPRRMATATRWTSWHAARATMACTTEQWQASRGKGLTLGGWLCKPSCALPACAVVAGFVCRPRNPAGATHCVQAGCGVALRSALCCCPLTWQHLARGVLLSGPLTGEPASCSLLMQARCVGVPLLVLQCWRSSPSEPHL